jgi:D-alanyl-D-alanine carboxypeptidase (penicillin-binding protein 5/6)
MVLAVLFRVLATLTAALLPGGDHTAVLARTPPPPLVMTAVAGAGTFRPRLTARAYIAIDRRTGAVLLARNPDLKRPIASLTKIMTGVLTAEAGGLDKKIRVPLAATQVEPVRDDLRAGHYYRRGLLLRSALMVSANDSAYTLAANLGGGRLERFYATMNAAARELGMTDTHYGSPNGLDDVHNWSSARDQALVARYALEDPVFAQVVSTRELSVPWARPVYRKIYRNHNRMLFSYPGTYGVKTGYTMAAGGCLVVAVRRHGHDVIAVVLGSRNIWQDMPRLVDAALARAS